METEIDEADEERQQPARGAGARRRRPDAPEGGKALERLRMVLEARGLSDEVPIDSGARTAGDRASSTAARDGVDGGVSAGGFEWAMLLAQADTELATGEVALSAAMWRPLGPTVMHNGQTYGTGTGSRVDVAGRVASIAVDPSNGNHLLVGAAGGGIWESVNQGATWTPRGDQLPTLAIGALCFDPADSRIVYAGTGEGDAFAALGQGVFRSIDGGTSWALRAGAPFVGVGFYALRVDPSDRNRLFGATRSGLYTSADAGVTWTQRRASRCYTVSVHPSGGNTEVLASFSDGVFRSTNAGVTWTAVTLPGVPNPAGFQRVAVCHAPSNPAVAWVWAATNPLIAAPGGGTMATPRLYRRTTLGGGFGAIGVGSGLNTGQAWYDWHVHAPPNSDSRVYVGEINLFRVELSGSSAVWTNLSAKINGDSIHPDQHCMAFDVSAGDVVYAGNDGGIYRSPNRGTNWVDLNDGLAIAEIEYMSHDPGSVRWLLGGTQDNGSIRYRGSPEWDHAADGDGGDCGVNTTDPTRVYHSYFRMGYDRSVNRGDTWTWVPTGNRDPSVYRQQFYPPMEARGATVAQAGESVFVSRNSGVSQVEIALPGRPTASAMYAPTADKIFVATTDGRLFRLTWSGSSWGTPTELTSPRAAYASDIFVDAVDHNRIWLTYSQLNGGRVYVTTDGGAHWTDRSAGLPALPINAVEVAPGSPNRAWVAADKGVYQTADGGATWTSMSVGLPNCIIGELLYHKHSRLLRAGTRNRGVWEIAVDGPLTQPVCGVQFTGSLAANETKRWFTFGWPATWHMIWTVMPTTVRNGAPQVWFDVQVERADAEFATYWITVKNLTNATAAFEGRYAILSFA